MASMSSGTLKLLGEPWSFMNHDHAGWVTYSGRQFYERVK